MNARYTSICILFNTKGWAKAPNSGAAQETEGFRSFKPRNGCPERSSVQFRLEPQSCYKAGIHKIFVNKGKPIAILLFLEHISQIIIITYKSLS
jgi:hypothetical protein